MQQLQKQVQQAVVGQEQVLNCLMVALLCGGNVLLEGLPGTAKTRTIKALAKALDASLGRIQFTPGSKGNEQRGLVERIIVGPADSDISELEFLQHTIAFALQKIQRRGDRVNWAAVQANARQLNFKTAKGRIDILRKLRASRNRARTILRREIPIANQFLEEVQFQLRVEQLEPLPQLGRSLTAPSIVPGEDPSGQTVSPINEDDL